MVRSSEVDEPVDYTPCDGCCAHCRYEGTEGEPCWGEVRPVDEVDTGDDWAWIHACAGHADAHMTGGPQYTPRPDQEEE